MKARTAPRPRASGRSDLAAQARGSTARTTLEFIRRSYGEDATEAILQALPPADRDALVGAATTDHIPYSALLALWQSADARLAPTAPRWMEDAGAFSIESLGQQLYGGLLRKASPLEFVTQSVSLYRLYYAQGDMQPVDVGPGRAVVRLVGFDALGPLFCRRQTGGLHRATEIAGGRDVRVRHVRCSFEGDAFCEWQVGWA